MTDVTVSSTPFRFFDLSREIRDNIYSFLAVPADGRAVGSLHECKKTATGCCCDECNVSGRQIDRHASSSDHVPITLRNDGDHNERNEGLSQHQACGQVYRPHDFGIDQCQIHRRLLSECTVVCEQQSDEPSRHYRQTYEHSRCLNVSNASNQMHQELTLFFFTRNTFEFHNSTDLLHFLRLNMPSYAALIRKVSLVLHIRSQGPHPQRYCSNIDRTSLVYALDLLAQLPNIQKFMVSLEFRVDRQLIMRRFAPWVEAKDACPTARAEHAKTIGQDAIWAYRPVLPEEDFSPDGFESLDLSVEAHSHARREFLKPSLIGRNEVAEIHDNHLTEIYAIGDDQMDRELMKDIYFVQGQLVSLECNLNTYDFWVWESRLLRNDVISNHDFDRAEDYLRDLVEHDRWTDDLHKRFAFETSP